MCRNRFDASAWSCRKQKLLECCRRQSPHPFANLGDPRYVSLRPPPALAKLPRSQLSALRPMLKQTCMLLGTSYCHRVISVLWVGDTFVFVTLGTVGVCEALVIWRLWRLWCSRESASSGTPGTRHDPAHGRTRRHRDRRDAFARVSCHTRIARADEEALT